MVAVFVVEILYVGPARLEFMRERPLDYARFQLIVLVFALLVGIVNIRFSAPPDRRVFRAFGRAIGGFVLGCTFYPAEPIALRIQRLLGYHPSHNFLILILMLALSILAATVAERAFRCVIRRAVM